MLIFAILAFGVPIVGNLFFVVLLMVLVGMCGELMLMMMMILCD